MGEVLRELNERKTDIVSLGLSPARLAGLINNVEKGRVNMRTGKDVFKEMVETGADADSIVAARGLEQISGDRELDAIIEEVLGGHREQVEGYLAGEEKLFTFLLGQVMKASGGKANPQKASERLVHALGERRGL